MVYFLSVLCIVLFVAILVLIFYGYRLAKIIFFYEDELTEIVNRLLLANERLDDVLKIRVLAEHYTGGRFMTEAANELRYCQFLVLSMVESSKMLVNKNYSKKSPPIEEIGRLHDRLKINGEYDPENDDGIHMMSNEEASSNRTLHTRKSQ